MKGIYWLGLLGIASFQAFFINPCFAQSSNIIPDNSLGAESSQVDENFQGLPPAFSRDKIETITGGAQRGINLFHSFQEFNVSEGRGTYFFSPNAEIQNILTRVTGRNPSEILGTLGTFGNSQPNFFLINPNGIVFGENASLDVGGSFVATTANGINLGETGLFSATEPEKSNLLSVNPSALFFNAVNNQAAIQNDSIAPAGTNPAGGNAFGLRVADGKSLLLVGGNVSMDRGRLNAYGGRVELGGLAAPGNVNLLSDGDNLKLGFPENATRSDVSLTNRAFVRVEADGGGDIAINSRNLDILQGSKLFAGIGRGLGTPETVAGDITLNATGEINVAGAGSIVRNFVRSGSQGNGGNITIDSGLFLLGEGGVLGASSFGKGNAGNVTVSAKDAISLRGNAAILSTVEASGVGDGGNIDINASTLSLTDGAGLATSISGVGNAGNIKVTATETVSLAGYPTVIYSGVEAEGEGQSGNIDINTATLSLTEGTELSASTRGMGNAGNIKVTATEAISLMDGNIISTVEAGGVGQGGNIDINAATLSLADSAQLITITRGASDTQPPGRGNAGNVNVRVTGLVDIAGVKNGLSSGILSFVGSGTKGKGGNITVDSGSLSLRNGAQLGASTRGMGDAGNVRVNTLGAVSLVSNAYILSTVEAGGDGQGGDIDINAATLSLTDSAQLLTITRSASDNQLAGRGNAGNVNVKVTGLVNIAGKKGIFASGIFSSVGTGTVGNGGNITVDSGSFLLRDGARIEASTFGMGDAGNVKVNTPGAVSLAGQPTGIFSTVEVGGKGRGGNIDINAATLSLTDGAQLQTITRSASDNQLAGQGDAGNVNVKATGSVNIAGKKDVFASGIFSSVGTGTVGNGGNITVDSGSFSLRDGASVAASTLGQGSAGNVKVNALDAVSLAGNVNIFSTVEAGGKGKGGNIDINAATLSLTDGAQLQTITRSAFNTQAVGRGDAGSVNVKVTGLVDIAGEKNGSFSGIFSFVDTGAEGNGGSITIDSGSFLLRDGAYLQASTYGIGNAGNVTFNTGNAVSLAGNVNIFSTVEAGGKGKGGNIDINAATLSLADGAQLLTLTREASDTQPPGQGDAGNVNVKVTGSVDIAGVKNGTFSAIFSSVGAGGQLVMEVILLLILAPSHYEMALNLLPQLLE